MSNTPYKGKIITIFNLTINDYNKDPHRQFSMIHDSDCYTLEEAIEEAKEEAKKIFEESDMENLIPMIKFTKVLQQEPTLLCPYEGWEANCGGLNFEIYKSNKAIIK